MTLELSPEAMACLLATAREAIASNLEARKPAWPQGAEALDSPCGAFVTLHRRGALRGCIGRMTSADPLFETIRAMARAAAFEDPRFPQLEAGELSSIDLEITVLSPLRRIASVDEIELGRHGVYLTRGWRSGVFLPQVAAEQGWDRDTLLEQLCFKAGLPGDAWRSADALIQVFEGLVFGEGKRRD